MSDQDIHIYSFIYSYNPLLSYNNNKILAYCCYSYYYVLDRKKHSHTDRSESFFRYSKEGKRKKGTDTRCCLDILFHHVSHNAHIFSSRSLHSSLTSPFFAFRDLRPVSLEKGQETLRLRVYACYAWGGPLLVAGLAALLDHLPSQPQYTFLRPRFGEKQCWFYGKFLRIDQPLVISA